MKGANLSEADLRNANLQGADLADLRDAWLSGADLRGPNRDGHVAGFKAPATWPKELTRKWRVTVGEGHSSPLLVGDRAYIHSRQGENEVLRAISLATGKELWKQSYPARYEMHPAARSHGKGPKSTPAYAGGRLYTLGISGILTCWEARSGKILWQKQFSQQHAKTSPLYGTAMSPLLADGLLIVHVGGHNDGALTAFDAKTGAVKWRWAEDGPAYASPIVATIGGVRQLITQTQKYCAGFSLADGKLALIAFVLEWQARKVDASRAKAGGARPQPTNNRAVVQAVRQPRADQGPGQPGRDT